MLVFLGLMLLFLSLSRILLCLMNLESGEKLLNGLKFASILN